MEGYFFVFVDEVGAVRACSFSPTMRTYHSGPWQRKPMIEKLSFLLCDVTAEAEMFLDFKKNVTI